MVPAFESPAVASGTMRVRFLGTGTSHGVPMIGCECRTCRSEDPRDRRWRPSVHVQLPDGVSILIDASTDLRTQALTFGIRRVDAILFTHSHADHIFGLDEVRRFNVLQQASVPCYGDARTLADLRRTFAYVFDRATPAGGGIPQLETFTVLGPFCLGSELITPVPILHGTRPILGYRIGAFAYLTDCSAIPDRSWPLLERLDLLVLGALRERPHPAHFSVSEAVQASQRLGARRTCFTHICHDLPHAETCGRLPATIELAYDGLVIDLPRDSVPDVPGASRGATGRLGEPSVATDRQNRLTLRAGHHSLPG
jgi:phosphoribosyl 1,2-cyclic phosphate phosphodiesterase